MSSARGNRGTGVQMTAGSSGEECCREEGSGRPNAVLYRCAVRAWLGCGVLWSLGGKRSANGQLIIEN